MGILGGGLRTTPENIFQLRDNEIFVFGSNLLGAHGAGAALLAYQRFEAEYGNGIGLQGRSYALPTKDLLIQTLSLEAIKFHVDRFIEFAKSKPDEVFLVTEIGCGLAGYKPSDIAPLFINAYDVENIHLPKRFWNVLLTLNKS